MQQLDPKRKNGLRRIAGAIRASASTLRDLLLLLAFANLAQSTLFSATPVSTLEGEETFLESHIQLPTTLVFTVTNEEELPEAQRLLTQAYASEQHALILIKLPTQTFRAAALRKAASKFFVSDFSKARIFYLAPQSTSATPHKTQLLAPNNPSPLFASPELVYPEISGND